MEFTRRGGGEEEVMNHRARTSASCLRHASASLLALERAFVKAGILRDECSLSKQDANIKCNGHIGPLGKI